jgi:hypothetical protein
MVMILAALLVGQILINDERTCFQTSQAYRGRINLKADVAIVYGIDPEVGKRVATWRDQGYDVHVMTGVAWGNYQDYLYGRFDGANHEDEAQTDATGNKIGHGGDVYYMSPGKNYGKFLCVGVKRALDAGANAIHLEEPEFWVRAGWSEGFKREWQEYYGEPWQAPDSSPDAQWRASKLKYFLYRRALQQVFDFVQEYNKANGRHVRCYVPTHSLLNYSQWNIVSPESSLARLDGCDGYIAQVWTGTARTPNIYRGASRERTFETAFLEYGAMQNLVKATGRRVWYLADPVEDDPNHDWSDYQRNYEATLTASLLQPEVWRYEVTPWPERVWEGKYPDPRDHSKRVGIPDGYASELQVVMNALKDMKQSSVEWDCGSDGIGVAVSDTLMFQRGGPGASDPALSHFYGLAMPFVKRGMPVRPVQLEGVNLAHYLDGLHILLMTYQGMKPPSESINEELANWVKSGGSLIFVDDDSDPFNAVREWWNSGSLHFANPREQLFSLLGISGEGVHHVGRGRVLFVRRNPVDIAKASNGDEELIAAVRPVVAEAGVKWKESGAFVLRRGSYVIAAGLSESPASPATLRGRFVDLFDPTLRVRREVKLDPDSRHFLIDLDRFDRLRGKDTLVAWGGEVSELKVNKDSISFEVAGIEGAPTAVLLRIGKAPRSVTVGGKAGEYRVEGGVAAIRFTGSARPLQIAIQR